MKKPRVSVNKLGEYMEAKPTRRVAIVKDAKAPKTFKGGRYNLARKIAKNYFIHNYDKSILTKGKSKLTSKVTSSDYQEQDKRLSINLIDFIEGLDFPDFGSLTVEKYDGENKKLNIEGVDISVYPDLIIRGEKRGKKIVGGIKIHISKNNSLTKEAGENIATILKDYIGKTVARTDEKVDNKICLSIDLFGNSVIEAPKSFKTRMKNVHTSCKEFSMWWDKL
jgi:hypothetical protein